MNCAPTKAIHAIARNRASSFKRAGETIAIGTRYLLTIPDGRENGFSPRQAGTAFYSSAINLAGEIKKTKPRAGCGHPIGYHDYE
jgi:hypothetical protein